MNEKWEKCKINWHNHNLTKSNVTVYPTLNRSNKSAILFMSNLMMCETCLILLITFIRNKQSFSAWKLNQIHTMEQLIVKKFNKNINLIYFAKKYKCAL